jgi:hypothetical protein
MHVAFASYAGVGSGSALKSADYSPTTGEITNNATVAIVPLGPVLINTVTSGNATFASATASATNVYQGISIDDVCDNQRSSYRVVSAAIEVVDRTATVNQQGTVTAYKQESNYQEAPYVLVGSNLTDTDLCPVRIMPPLPSTLSDVEQIANYKARSSEGLLMPIKIQADSPKFLAPIVVCQVLDTAASTSNCFVNGLAYRDETVNTDRSSITFSGESGGALFSGLNAAASFEVRLRMVIEEFPASSDSSSMSFARPSPEFDPAALNCVPELFQRLPAAVPVSQNASGDWWGAVVRAARTVASTMAPIAMKAIGTASRAIDPTGTIDNLANKAGGKLANVIKPPPRKRAREAVSMYDQKGPQDLVIQSSSRR